MPKLRMLLLTAMAAMGTVAALASAGTAGAKPSYDAPCANCHIADSAVAVSANATANDGTNTTYTFHISGPYSGSIGYGVFDSAGNKVAGAYASSGSLAVANWGSYTLYGVNKDRRSMHGVAHVTLNPASPPAGDLTPTPVATPTSTTTPNDSAGPSTDLLDSDDGDERREAGDEDSESDDEYESLESEDEDAEHQKVTAAPGNLLRVLIKRAAAGSHREDKKAGNDRSKHVGEKEGRHGGEREGRNDERHGGDKGED